MENYILGDIIYEYMEHIEDILSWILGWAPMDRCCIQNNWEECSWVCSVSTWILDLDSIRLVDDSVRNLRITSRAA